MARQQQPLRCSCNYATAAAFFAAATAAAASFCALHSLTSTQKRLGMRKQALHKDCLKCSGLKSA